MKDLTRYANNKMSVERIRTLNMQMTIFVFYITLLSGLLTGGSFAFLYFIGFFPLPFFTPIFSPFIILIISIFIGTSLTAVACEKFLNPLNELIKATKIVSTGDFNIRVKETNSKSEIGILIKNFNQMAEELGSIEMFRNDFINSFSHEFKTPLSSIRGFAKQLQNDDLSPEKRREYTDIIINEVDRMSNMSANILLLSKLENQQIISDTREYALDEQLRNCIILFEKQWTIKNIELNLELEAVTINSNAELLSHLFINLIDNAIKYTNQNGHIKITLCESTGNVFFSISDDGEGMSEHTRRNIFDKFYQGDKSRSTQGSGLGLSIVKRVADMCGGEISVESSPDIGTTFKVRLPKKLK